MNFHHGLAIKNAHQVKAEAIKSVELNPLFDRLFDIVANHSSLARYIVATEGSVGSLAVLVIAIKVAWDNLLKSKIVREVNVVIDDVHDEAEIGLMVGINHLL